MTSLCPDVQLSPLSYPSSAPDKRPLRLHLVIDSLPLLQWFRFSYSTEITHFGITYVGGNHIVDVPTIPDLHLLGASCLFKRSIPGECSSVVFESSIDSFLFILSSPSQQEWYEADERDVRMALSRQTSRQNGIKQTNETSEWHKADEQGVRMTLRRQTRHRNNIKSTNKTTEWH